MALIKCKECGQEVSDTCNTCPKCGADIQQQIYDSLSDEEKAAIEADRNNVIKWILLGLTVILLIWSISEYIDLKEFKNMFGEGYSFGHMFLVILVWAGTLVSGVATFKRFFRR